MHPANLTDATVQTASDRRRRIAVIGAGAWGTALASVFSRAGHAVSLFGRDPATVAEINERHTNGKYLSGVVLPGTLTATGDMRECTRAAEFVFLVVPTQELRRSGRDLAGLLSPAAVVINCAKGIDRQSGRLPHEVLAEALPGVSCGVLSGPSFAEEVAAGKPTAVTLAMPDAGQAMAMAESLSTPDFRIYASDDVAGVEAGGALKNVVAIAVGICRGMDLGASAEAALIARGHAEVTRLAVKLGAQSGTLQGLSGLGDLVLTCSSPKSRNFAFGMALGRGEPAPLRLAEGMHTAGIAADIAARHEVAAPIVDIVSRIVSGTIGLKDARAALLNRPVRLEA
jgi:glycerol-3-phosphate dehydrogenase (NAD(P)+)